MTVTRPAAQAPWMSQYMALQYRGLLGAHVQRIQGDTEQPRVVFASAVVT